MQDRPDKLKLLESVARFLGEELAPAIEDRGLAFRVRIAAWLTQMVALELLLGDAQDAAQLQRLRELFAETGDVPAAPAKIQEAIAHLEARLVDRIREGDLGDAERERITAHVKQSLREKLVVVQPRFDTRPDIEG
jgi:predicted nucleic acid-binding protein